jgi:hypothetical protein
MSLEDLKGSNPNQVQIVVGSNPDEFEKELNLALASGFQLYGEYHYCTWLDDATGRVEQWSMAVTRHNPGTIERILTK